MTGQRIPFTLASMVGGTAITAAYPGKRDSNVPSRKGVGAAAITSVLDADALLAIADSLPVMIGYVGRDHRYAYVNQPLAEWLEQPREALVRTRVADTMDAESFASWKGPIDEALNGERQWLVVPINHPTRGKLTTQIDLVPHMSNAAVLGVILIAQDVTEQRAAETALRESEARFLRIADFAPVMMWVSRADGTRDFVNRAYLEFAGLPAEQARTHDWRDWIHPDDWAQVVAASQAGEASCAPFVIEGRFRRHDGEWRWLRSVSSPRLGPNGEVIGFIGAASDVTPAKEAEQRLTREVEQRTRALAESESRFRAIFDSVLQVMVLLDPDGTVVEVNRTSSPWRSRQGQLAIGRKLWDSPTFATYAAHAATIRQAVAIAAKGDNWTGDLQLEGNPDMGLAPAFVEATMQPVRDSAGTITHLLFEARDVTELKQAQDQLRQSQKMEALGQLTGGIAHDFNNLLTVVVGGLDLISKRIEDPKLLRYATNALSAAERGARLTAQLLTFSRSQRLEVRPCYVESMIEEMRPLLRNVLGPGIEKRFDLDTSKVPVMADPTQFEVAVLNLAINARDAMPAGGVLSFVTRIVKISDDPELSPGDYVELSIVDTGQGMSPEVLARAFEPFFTTKEVGKGTGLGLSMVYGMARQSGGTARVESELGRGTTVRLFFRSAESGAVALPTKAVAGGTTATVRGAKVVVIDDDPDVRSFVYNSLIEMGYQVEQAADGATGIALVNEVSPDVVVIDYLMPGLSGAEVAERIRERHPDQPILFVSGYSETDDIRRVAPEASLLAKPFRPDALDAAVRELLAGRRIAANRGN